MTNVTSASPKFTQQSKSSSALLQSLIKKPKKNKVGVPAQSLSLSPSANSACIGNKHVESTLTIPADVTTYPFKILTSATLEKNETTLKKFIGAQLDAEYNQSASTLSITFEMVLHYIKENRSLRSFIELVKAEAVAHKDVTLENLKTKEYYVLLSSTEQNKITTDCYNQTQKYVFKIGTQIYEFLKEYYIASRKGTFNVFFCKYPFMETQSCHLLSRDSLKCVIEKVYKEDFILIEAQKRTGLLSIAQNGLLGKVLHNPEVISTFKSGKFEDSYSMIKSLIIADGQSFILCDKKKRHIHRMLSELTCSDNPFPSNECAESTTAKASLKELASAKEIASSEKLGSKNSSITAKSSSTSSSSLANIVTDSNGYQLTDTANSSSMENRIEVFTRSIGRFISTLNGINGDHSTEEQMNMFLLRTISSLHQFYSLEALQNALSYVQSKQFNSTSAFFNSDFDEPGSSPPLAESGKMDLDTTGVTTAEADLSGISHSDSSPSPSLEPLAESGKMDLDTTCVTSAVAEKLRFSNSVKPVSSPSYDLERDGLSYLEPQSQSSDRLFSLLLINLVGCDGVRVISISSADIEHEEGIKESCFLLSAVLTMILHSIRLIRFSEDAERHPDIRNHVSLRTKLLSNFDKWGINNVWPYEEVLAQLSLNPLEFPHQTFSDSNFHFGNCVKRFITPSVLRKKGLRCIGSIELSSCVDYNSLQSSLQVQYLQSLNESNELDNSLAFVNVCKSDHADATKRLKTVPYTVILKSDDQSDHCFQLSAALYISEARTLKVIQITRSIDTAVLGSNYFHFAFDVGSEYNNSLHAVPCGNLIPSEVSSRFKESCVLTLLPGNFHLSGLVFMKSSLQLSLASKNPYFLSPELCRRNEFGGVYGREEHTILSSTTRWLSNPIMNSIFGFVSKSTNEVAGEEGTRHILLSSLFFQELLSNPENFDRLDFYAPDIDMNDSNLNAIVHGPVNYPVQVHWVYVFLHIKTKCIYLMDSGKKNKNNEESIKNKFQAFLFADFNRRKQTHSSSSSSSRHSRFREWEFRVIKSPLQQDDWNCGVYTIMNMVRICDIVKRNGYLTSAESSASVSAAVLKEFRRKIFQILFENKSVNDLLTYVNKFPTF